MQAAALIQGASSLAEIPARFSQELISDQSNVALIFAQGLAYTSGPGTVAGPARQGPPMTERAR